MTPISNFRPWTTYWEQGKNGKVIRPTHTVKKDRRYFYYVSKHLLISSGDDDAGWRLTAKELEHVVASALWGC